MKVIIPFCMLISHSLPFPNNMEKEIDTSVEICTKRIIKKMFNEETVWFILNKEGQYLLSLNISNPKVVIATDRRLLNDNNLTMYNFILQVETLSSLKRSVRYMTQDDIWSRFKSRTERGLVITNKENLAKEIFRYLWMKNIVYFVLLVINEAGHYLYTGNPNKRPIYLQKQSCEHEIVETIPKVLRNYGGYEIFCIHSRNGRIAMFDPERFTLNVLAEVVNISLTRDAGFEALDRVWLFHDILSEIPSNEYRGSKVYGRDILVWIVPPTNQISGIEIFIILLNKIVWIMIVVAFMLTILTWYVIDRLKTSPYNSDLSGIILMIFGITLQGSTSRIPTSPILRFLMICYIVYSIHIQVAYLSNLIEVLTTPPYEKGIENIEELVHSNLPIATSFEDHSYFFDSTSVYLEKYPEMRIITNFTDLTQISLYNLIKYRNLSMVTTMGHLHELELAFRLPRTPNYFIDNLTSPTIQYRYRTFTTHGYLIDTLDEIIDRLTESGLYNKLEKDEENYVNQKMIQFKGLEENVVLSLNHLSGIFVIFAFCLALSILVFIGELIVYRCKNY